MKSVTVKQASFVGLFSVLVAAIVVFVLCLIISAERVATPVFGTVETSLVSMDNEEQMVVEWRRRRDRNRDDFEPNDSGYDDYRPPRRSIRRKIFDGSRLKGMGAGLLWLAVGIVAVPVSCLLSFVLCKKILGIK